MIVKIGYIGSKHSVQTTRKLSKDIAGIRLRTYIYESPADIPALHQQAVKETDVICFSGIVSHYYRDRSIKTDKSVIITPFHEYMVVASLLTCLLHYSVTINDISIDLPNKAILEQIEKDMPFSLRNGFVYDYKWIYDRKQTKELVFNDIADFHERLYRQHETKMAVTSIHYVYDKLIQNNVPAIYMVDHDRNMKRVLIDAKKSVLYARLRGGMIATIYITLQDEQAFKASDVKRITSIVQSVIKMVNFELEHEHTLAFYTTRGMMEECLGTEKNGNWITQLETQLRKVFYIGIGYGRHLFEAEENAELALETAQTCTDSNGYIITEQKKLIGPLVGQMISDEIRISDNWLRALTEQTKTNRTTMNRFIQFMRTNAYQPFTVSELAQFSNVTVRTSERFIKNLYEAKVLYLYGKEQNHHKGRPRNVYALAEEIENKFRNMK